MGLSRRPSARARISSPLRVTAEHNPTLRATSALTASGMKITRRDGDTMRRLLQPWQARAFSYYDMVPEIKYAAQFYSRALSVLRLYPAVMDENDELVETTDQAAVENLDRIRDPGGGRSVMLASYGRLMFLAGEATLLVTRDEDSDEEQWEMLSTDEVRVIGGQVMRMKAPSLGIEDFYLPQDKDYAPTTGKDAIPYRLWRRHPRFSMLADSTMQGVLDICEELVLLTQAVRARARSRLAGSGILLVNGRYFPLPPETVPDEDPQADPLMNDLTEAMMSPTVDEGSPSAVVPLLLRIDVPKESSLDDVMKHIQIIDPTQLYPESGLRREAIERLAIGLDMPPEILLGLADSNHWTSWQIDEQTWKGHLQPVAQQLVDDLTSSYYQPTLRAAGVPNWRDYYIAYDATEIINHPDRTKDAKDLYDKRAIGKTALRKANGFDEDDAPTVEELDEMVGVAVHDGSLAKFGIPSVRSGGIEPQAGELETGQGTSTAGTSSPEATKAPPEQTAEKPTDGAVIGSGRVNAQVVARILGACDITLQRARELAGSRLRTQASRGKRDKEATRLIDGVPNALVAARLGREKAVALGAVGERELVAGAREMLAATLRTWRLDAGLADLLGERIEQHAARHLWEEDAVPLPQTFANYVAGLDAVKT